MGYGTKLNEYIEGGVGGPAFKSDQFSEVVGFIIDANRWCNRPAQLVDS
jgi:hypothetical protein